MQKLKIAILALSISIIVGCNYPNNKIDGSSQEKLHDSIKELTNKMTVLEQEEFTKYMLIVSMKDINIFNTNETDMEIKIQNALNGKTIKDVIEEGKNIERKAVKDREEKQALRKIERTKEIQEEISTLEEKIKNSEDVQKQLDLLTVSDEKFSIENYNYSQQPLIQFKLKNDTGVVIKRVYAVGKIFSEGRTIPWYEGDFNFYVSGGLEVNEERSVSLTPNIFSEWGRVEAPKDALFKVKIVGFEDSNDIRKDVFHNDEIKKELAVLKKELKDLK